MDFILFYNKAYFHRIKESPHKVGFIGGNAGRPAWCEICWRHSWALFLLQDVLRSFGDFLSLSLCRPCSLSSKKQSSTLVISSNGHFWL